MVLRLKFDLSSYWQVRSGAGAGALADSVIVRDASGLPVVPGRAVKGLLREAMELLTASGKVSQDSVVRWFGSPLPAPAEAETDPDLADTWDTVAEEARFQSKGGELWFGSAAFPPVWRDWIDSKPEKLDAVMTSLTTFMASTAITSDGVAKDHTLRVSEVAVPMELVAEVRGPAGDDKWKDDIRAALPLVRALGGRRSRGYGRVDVSEVKG